MWPTGEAIGAIGGRATDFVVLAFDDGLAFTEDTAGGQVEGGDANGSVRFAAEGRFESLTVTMKLACASIYPAHVGFVNLFFLLKEAGERERVK